MNTENISESTAMSEMITCQICSKQTHVIVRHLREEHPDYTIERYREEFPDAPILSLAAEEKIRERMSQDTIAKMLGVPQLKEAKKSDNVVTLPSTDRKATLASHFGLSGQDLSKAKSAAGEEIAITIKGTSKWTQMVPKVDPNYVRNVDLIRVVMMGLEKNLPTYLFGHAGTGKSSVIEFCCAMTNRPMIRVQHTIGMEPSSLTGKWTVKGGETIFQPGPLTLALKHGWTFVADEMDAAYPSTLLVYQAILEGKALVVEDADEEFFYTEPHPDFRFFGTGNTNGSGDETGLYQARNIQDRANYSRFAIIEEVDYMPPSHETALVQMQGGCTEKEAELLVKWAGEIRKSYPSKIGSVVGPRELINAAKVGSLRADMRWGVARAITNKWSKVDREVGEEIAQRIFG